MASQRIFKNRVGNTGFERSISIVVEKRIEITKPIKDVQTCITDCKLCDIVVKSSPVFPAHYRWDECQTARVSDDGGTLGSALRSAVLRRHDHRQALRSHCGTLRHLQERGEHRAARGRSRHLIQCVIVWLNAASLDGSGSELAARPVGFYFPPMTDSEENLLPLRSFTCFKTLLLSLAASLDTKNALLHLLLRFVVHPEYDTNTHLNDIALVHVGADILFNGIVGPACLPFRFTRETFDGRTVVALGKCRVVHPTSLRKLLSSSLLSKNLNVRIYKTVILPVVLYSCETWTLTLREEQRLRVFENKVLRKIFGAKRDEVTGEWRKLHNTELHALYSSPGIIRNIKSRRLRWTGHVARMGESRNAYRVLVGRPEGKRPLGRPRRRWEDNIKMDLREVEYDDRDWINLAQDRDQWRAYVRAAMNLRDYVAAGWGVTKFEGVNSNVLQKVGLTVINDRDCFRMYQGMTSSDQICTYAQGKMRVRPEGLNLDEEEEEDDDDDDDDDKDNV
ncbi:hypothetical protein ANN_25693 [Periplaneta americana]|uniref:Peptidase S1 domain-containing protein n=1 Tax=Periplaneta americana TaxID=6978 RepID=A0ABQ8S4M5_PERAM|nr:hypothetical protein ANN_25693 [Periplaneta americana]